MKISSNQLNTTENELSCLDPSCTGRVDQVSGAGRGQCTQGNTHSVYYQPQYRGIGLQDPGTLLQEQALQTHDMHIMFCKQLEVLESCEPSRLTEHLLSNYALRDPLRTISQSTCRRLGLHGSLQPLQHSRCITAKCNSKMHVVQTARVAESCEPSRLCIY